MERKQKQKFIDIYNKAKFISEKEKKEIKIFEKDSDEFNTVNYFIDNLHIFEAPNLRTLVDKLSDEFMAYYKTLNFVPGMMFNLLLQLEENELTGFAATLAKYQMFHKDMFKEQIGSTFLITKEIYQQFINLDLPDITLKDVGLEMMPSLFIFEDNVVLKMIDECKHMEGLKYSRMTNKEMFDGAMFNNVDVEKQISVYASHISWKKYAFMGIFHDMPLSELNKYQKQQDNEKSIMGYWKVALHILAFIKAKNMGNFYVKDDLNLDREKHLATLQYSENPSKRKKAEDALAGMPPWTFTDLDLTFIKCRKYYQSQGKANSKMPKHWRSAHYHSYWKLNRETNVKEKIWHYIPAVLVNAHLEGEAIIPVREVKSPVC